MLFLFRMPEVKMMKGKGQMNRSRKVTMMPLTW